MKTGYQRRQDSNHASIVHDLRKLGYAILDLSRVAGGCPDLLICKQGKWWLVEIKSSAASKLNKKQIEWRKTWNGPAPLTARSIDDILMWV